MASTALVLGADATQATDPAVFEQAAAAIWNAHDKALSEHDVDGIMATWADAEDSVMIGTGPGERWVGTAEIREAYENFVQDFDPYTMESVCGWHIVDDQENIAWAWADATSATPRVMTSVNSHRQKKHL